MADAAAAVRTQARTSAASPAAAWLPAAEEEDAYERIRRGDEAAFRRLAEPLQPVLRRLAGLTVSSRAEVDAVVVRTWVLALGGLDMFRWQTPLATWVAGLAVGLGRAHHARGSAPPAPPAPRAPSVPAAPRLPPPAPAPPARSTSAGADATSGPGDWSDLPWGARWEHAWPLVGDTLARLPLAQREVVHTRDVERWPGRRVCDVLGLPEAAYERLLAQGRTRVRDELAALVHEPAAARHHAAQIAAVADALHGLRQADDAPLDARTLAAFHRWRASRRTGWRGLPHRLVGRRRVDRLR